MLASMAPGHGISIQVDRPFAARVDRRPLAALARRVLRDDGVPAPAELSILVTGDDAVRELNRRYRGVDAATDVLSFDTQSKEPFVTPADAVRQLGDVVVSLPTAERQAAEGGRALSDELNHLVVHGVLHLLGYDHEAAGDARKMRAREEEVLGGTEH